MARNTILWLVWIAATVLTGGALAAVIYVGGSRDLLLIGETTGVHHQIELACGACHTSDISDSTTKASKAMTKACLACHDDELKLSNDSHPIKKFRDPRNADRREMLDALFCQTCHLEHRPEVTGISAVTLPMDYCTACHQDIYKNRPSHEGYGFETCASAGCHNYHDNTALYEDFLLKHGMGPEITDQPVTPGTAISRGPKPLAVALTSPDPAAALTDYLNGIEDDPAAAATQALGDVLTGADAVAPTDRLTEEALAAWTGSPHALAGVNCGGCHAPKAEGADEIAAAWVERPGLDACKACHKDQARTFTEGLHGMRFHPELPKPRKAPKDGVGAVVATLFHDTAPEPITVADSDLALKPAAAAREIGNCNTCHLPHEADIQRANVEACAGCHDDPHTRAYFGSPHEGLWQAELAGGAPGSGVTCADCHMPKVEGRRGALFTTHNQNSYLRPNEKMIRTVCLSCHGLAFSIDALADPELVEGNFNGRPSVHIPSIDWALKRTRKTE